jgi:NADH dehydrogenase/NADH:ubiquinone oxidoreductase subunit G
MAKSLDQSGVGLAQMPVELLVNGKAVRAHPGQTVLEVVRDSELDDIPTLCYDRRLELYGS